MKKLIILICAFLCLSINGCQISEQDNDFKVVDKNISGSKQGSVQEVLNKKMNKTKKEDANILDEMANEDEQEGVNNILNKSVNESYQEENNLLSGENINEKEEDESISDNEVNLDGKKIEEISKEKSEFLEEDSQNENKNEEVIDYKIEVDLTKLSSTMVYAEVYNMIVYPEDYLGKIIKMKGIYYPTYYEETDKYYHYVVIEDATACCKQGMEFMLGEEYIYPEDYPPEFAEIEVTGIYSVYEELGYTFYYFDATNIKILE